MNILKFLNEKKMTQQELGDSLGTSNQNVNRWVTGKGVPSYEFCKKLLEMGMLVEDLFEVDYKDLHKYAELFAEESDEKISKDDFRQKVFEVIDEYKRQFAQDTSFLDPAREVVKSVKETIAPVKEVVEIAKDVAAKASRLKG